MAESPNPRRSALLQTRSRNTRRALIRAALDLWKERGFEAAFEETTAEEIARAAGVSKGTFYFHFAHKEDILLEMQWATADLMIEEAARAIERGEETEALVRALMASLARRVSKAPRAAVLRGMGHWARLSQDVLAEGPRGFGQAFHAVLVHGRERGDLPAGIDAEELSSLLQAATMDALVRWAASDQSPAALQELLSRRAEVVLRGATASYS